MSNKKDKLRPFLANDEVWEMARFKSVYKLGTQNRSEYIRQLIINDKNYKDR